MEYLKLFQEPVTFHLIIAGFLGALFGLERELARKDPSLRTFMLISLGSCTFAIISLQAAAVRDFPNADPGRIGAQIVVGIGFLGAGTIFRARDRIVGLTTAALMWLTSAIGMAVGFDRLDVAFKATIVALSFMIVLNVIHRLIHKVLPDETE